MKMTTSVNDIQLLSGATKADGLEAIAHCRIHNDEPVAVWRVNPESLDVRWKQSAPPWPCFPLFAPCLPLVYMDNRIERGHLQHTLYILGKKNIYNFVFPYDVGAKKAGCNRCCYTCCYHAKTGYEPLRVMRPDAWVENVCHPRCHHVDAVKIMAPFDSSLNHQRGENKGHNDGWFAMYVSNPEETCTMINNALYLARQEAVQTQMETQPPAVPVGSTKAKLQEFAEMRDMGLLSIQEFEDKKAELLREM